MPAASGEWNLEEDSLWGVGIGSGADLEGFLIVCEVGRVHECAGCESPLVIHVVVGFLEGEHVLVGVVESALGVGLDGEVDCLHAADDFLEIRGVGEEFGAAEAGLLHEDGVIAVKQWVC